MRAAVWYEAGSEVIEYHDDVEVDDPGPGEVKVRIHAAGARRAPRRRPAMPGVPTSWRYSCRMTMSSVNLGSPPKRVCAPIAAVAANISSSRSAGRASTRA